MRESTVKTACVILLSVAILPACGLIEKLSGEKEDKAGEHGQSPVEPIPYKKLIQLLPKMEGWKAQPPQGKISSVGEHKITRASANYEKNADGKRQTVNLEILDGSYIPSVYAPFAVMAHSRGAMLDAHKMEIEVDGYHGLQQWEPQSGKVTVFLLVARRFVITLKGTHIPPATVKQYIHAINLKKLASWS